MNDNIRKYDLQSEFIIQIVLGAYHTLCHETDLSPHNECINRALSTLVYTLSERYGEDVEQAVLNDPRVLDVHAHLLNKLSRSEYEMELFWADKFLSATVLDLKALEQFWYWENYCGLVQAELDAMPVQDEDSHIVFVGAGPLPLSAIIMQLQTGARITCVDIDPDACDRARRLIERLDLQRKMEVVCASGTDYDYRECDAVILAALVPEKEAVLDKIAHENNNCVIGMRSAEGLHCLLYERTEDSLTLDPSFMWLGKSKTTPEIINTTNFYSILRPPCIRPQVSMSPFI